MDNAENSFQYTYSAQERSEVEQIRKKYLPPQEDKMAQLRRLDQSATQKAQACAIALGTVGALILGAGMSMIMTSLGEILGLGNGIAMLVGIVAGLAGLLMMALAYPAYNRVLQKQRQRIAPEILRLTEELMK